MQFFQKLRILLVIGLLAHSLAGAATFTAALDRDAMTLGEQVTLSLKFEGAQADAPEIPPVAGLQISYVGPSSAFSFINGRTTSSVTHTYVVTAQRAGEFVIPSVTAQVEGQNLRTGPLKLVVTKVAAPTAADVNAGNEPAFMKLVLPKNKVYLGEPLVARVELYLRDDVQNFGNFQMTGASADGFNGGKLSELPNQQHRQQVGNRVYRVIPLAIPLTAVRSGALTVGPFTASAVLVLPGRSRGDDPFSQLGMRSPFFNGEQKQVTLATEAVAVEVLPLPTQNRPANFTGAIGNFTVVASAGPTNLTVGDPITVRVQVSGQGVFDSVTLPLPDTWRDFKAYPPTVKLETDDSFGLHGSKTFEQIVSPQNADVRELPAFSFAFFNPEDGRYHVLTEPAHALVIKAAVATPPPVVAAGKNTSAENAAPQDVLPLKEELGALAKANTVLITQPAFLMLQGVPVLAFLAALIWRRRADSLANNPRLRRQRAVAQLVREGLVDLKKLAAENRSDDFFAQLFRLLQEQLGERLDCPASAITENVIDEQPVLQKASRSTVELLRELFQLCNQARYAPVRGSSELNSVAVKFEKAVAELQEVKS